MAEQTESDGSTGRFDNPVVYLLGVLALLLAGGGVSAYLILSRPKPSEEPEEVSARVVRVFAAQKTSHRLAITAYGTSRAAEVWTAIAEVKGRAVEVNPCFEPGEILPAGTVLVRIDRIDYELARDRFQAEAKAKQLQIKELNQSEDDLREVLKLQQRQLELAQAEYERERKLHAKKAVPLSTLEVAENAYVTQQTAVQKTRNALALVSVQRLQLEALLKVATVQLDQVLRDLDRCRIRLPLDARCASKSIEDEQLVTAGERLGTFLTLKAAEVVALVETRKVAALMRGDSENFQPLDMTAISRQGSLWKRFPIPVEVSWALGEQPVVWWGRLARIGSSLDPGTRTVPLIIEVPNPYEDIWPGGRPPLLPDVFCEVTAYGATVKDVVVIPRDCLHEISRERLQEGSDSRAVVYLLRNWKLFMEELREGELRVEEVGEEELPVEEIRDGKLYIQGMRDGKLFVEEAGDAKSPGQEGRNRKLRIHGELHIREVAVLALEKDRAVIGKGIGEGDLVILSDVPRVQALSDVLLASEEMPLRGALVENPVKPRDKIGFPDDLFEELDEAEGRQASEPSADRLPTAAPPVEMTP